MKGLAILNVGCGEGDNAGILARKGAKVTGIDLSKEILRLKQVLQKPHSIIFETVKDTAKDHSRSESDN